MKHLLLVASLAITALGATSQNVGINTKTPQATLDVRGNQRTGGVNNFMSFDTATGRIQWTGASLFTPVSQQIIRHSASAEGLYAGGGKLEYRNQLGSPVFYSDWKNGNGYFSGNVGIGTITPLARLHVFNGASGANASTFSPMVIENDGNTYINLLSPAINETGILFGRPGSEAHGAIIYNNVETPDGFQFRDKGNIIQTVIDENGRLGIGLTAPKYPISMNGSTGDKISLWTDGSSTHYGLGVQSGLLQLFTKTVNDDIAFGYGSSSSFTERMRIKGNGNAGFGNSNPAYRLDVSGRMRIRSDGSNDVSAGVWLNNNANNEAAFVGMEDDTHVGFFGSQSGFRFGMNTVTGALKINGSEGVTGQILQSNGGGQAATWKDNTVTDFFNLTEEVACTAEAVITAGATADVPGLTKTFTIGKPSKVIIQFMVLSGSTYCTFCDGTIFDMIIDVDNGNTGRVRFSVANGEHTHVSGSRIFLLQPGTHAIKITANTLTGPDLRLGQSPGAYPSFMSIQVIPAN